MYAVSVAFDTATAKVVVVAADVVVIATADNVFDVATVL